MFNNNYMVNTMGIKMKLKELTKAFMIIGNQWEKTPLVSWFI